MAEDSNAKIEVNGMVVQSGQASQEISLGQGSNTITVKVTSAVGDSRTYTINPVRASNNYLSGITVKSGRATVPLTPADFSKTVYQYSGSTTMTVSLLVTATAEDASACTIKIKGLDATSGTALSVPVVAPGSNTIDIVVTSKTGADSKTYNCIITVS